LTNKADLDYVVAHMDELVIKETQGSGGYGMLVGPMSTKEERVRYLRRVLDAPERLLPSRRCRFPPALLSLKVVWCRATSICGPLFFRVSQSILCQVA
jgi:uncharacterized circularly permuted ATP-grasp superfamily protein